MRLVCSSLIMFLAIMSGPSRLAAADRPPLEGIHRVLFLGDSITYAGHYIDLVEAYLRVNDPTFRCEFLNLGLPSETVSGLSEPGHAGGQFPRPELRERLDRVLEQTRPGLVVACYGMNDGIYHPFQEARLKAFQEGMGHLRQRAGKLGAKVLHLTPPVFDPTPIKARTLPAGMVEYRQPFEGYDTVLERYSEWLISQRSHGWDVVDVHGPMKRFLTTERRRDPGFRLADDGVHINATGHWLIAREILVHWGEPPNKLAEYRSGDELLGARPHGREVLALVAKRQAALKDAWLTATGHKRPGMAKGMELADARRQAQEIERRIQKLIGSMP